MTARARELALEKRKKTLLVEYQANKKANTFKDRRFGEGDPSLSLEERMLMRFQKERQRKARRSSAGLFNLDQPDFQDDDDEDGGGLLLTHKGRAIGEDDFFGGGGEAGFGSSDEEDERGQLGSDIVKVRMAAWLGPPPRMLFRTDGWVGSCVWLAWFIGASFRRRSPQAEAWRR